MADHDDVRDHLNDFFDTVDKLGDMDIKINPELLAVMLLYSLPSRFETFRCAIESRDTLPSPETLRTKIIEENDARKSNAHTETAGAMFVNKNVGQNYKKNKTDSKNINGKDKRSAESEFRCFKCKKPGHRKSQCRYNNKQSEESKKNNQTAKLSKEICLRAVLMD